MVCRHFTVCVTVATTSASMPYAFGPCYIISCAFAALRCANNIVFALNHPLDGVCGAQGAAVLVCGLPGSRRDSSNASRTIYVHRLTETHTYRDPTECLCVCVCVILGLLSFGKPHQTVIAVVISIIATKRIQNMHSGSCVRAELKLLINLTARAHAQREPNHSIVYFCYPRPHAP